MILSPEMVRPANDIDYVGGRALMNEVAAGQFAAVERVDTDPALTNSLTQLAASSFSTGMGYAMLALCELSIIGAVRR